GGGLPVVRQEDLPADFPADARALAIAADSALVGDIRVNLATGQPRDSDIATFGAYLHAVLFGGHWPAIAEAAAGQQGVLALRRPVPDWELARLPWEVRQAPDSGTGAWSAIAWSTVITRVVPPRGWPGDASRQLKIQISPRVLFVIGTELGDESIRPGA